MSLICQPTYEDIKLYTIIIRQDGEPCIQQLILKTWTFSAHGWSLGGGAVSACTYKGAAKSKTLHTATHALTAATNPLQTKSVSRRICLVPASASSRAPTVLQKLPLGLFAQALVNKSFKYFLFYKKKSHIYQICLIIICQSLRR